MSKFLESIKLAFFVAKQIFKKMTFNNKWNKFWTIAQWIWISIFKIFEKNLDYRDLEDKLKWWKEVREILELKKVPDYTTINRNLRKITEDMMSKVNSLLLSLFWEELSWISAEDTTWLKEDNRSSYYSKRSWKKRKKFTKLWLSVDINCLALYWFCSWSWPWSDVKYWEKLKLLTLDKNIWVRLKDAWFDWWNNIEDVVPPVARWWSIKSINRIERKNELELLKECWLFWYRWTVETVYSVIKRKFTDSVREKLNSSKITMSNLIALVYMVRLWF